MKNCDTRRFSFCRSAVALAASSWITMAAGGDIHFSHAPGTVGLPPNSAVAALPDTKDIFATLLPLGGPGAFGNFLVADNPAAFGLQPADNVDAIHDSGTRLYGANGLWEPSFVFSVRTGAVGQAGTPVNLQVPFNAADLYQIFTNQGHFLLNLADQFGLSKSNFPESVDGLALEPFNPFGFGQRVHFSLAPGSPTLVNNGWSAADILTAIVGVPGTLQVSIPAAKLGLNPADNIDGLIIYQAFDDEGDGRLDGPDDSRSVYFSVGPGSLGAAGTAVRAEHPSTGGNGNTNDVFTSGALAVNTLVVDGVRWTRLAGNDDIDALDVVQVFFDDPPFITPGALPPLPTRNPATLPPAYQNNPTPKPIGGFYVPICAWPTPKDVWYEIILKLCDPSGGSVQVKSTGVDHLKGPGDATYKANKIAEILKGMTVVNPGGNPATDAKKIFSAVTVNNPPTAVKAPGVVAEVCVVVDQAFIDRGWALDAVCISFNNWTMSIVPMCELGIGPPPPAAVYYRLPGVKIPAVPKSGGVMRLSFWDGIPIAPTIVQYSTPFAAGQDPITILQDLRNQIIAQGGDAEFDGDMLLIAAVPVEPNPLTNAEAGPYLYEAGAIGNEMLVTLDLRGTNGRVNLLGCGGYLSGECCNPSFTAGCKNEACCSQVCAFNPFCCEVSWDQLCAEMAGLIAACGCNAPPNDECVTPTFFSPGSLPFGIFGATPSGPFDSCGFTATDGDAWYTFIAPCNGIANLSLLPAFNMIAGLYGGCPGPGSSPIGCAAAMAGDQTSVSVPTFAGQQFFVRIGGLGGAQGTGIMDLTITCSCAADIAPPPNGNGVVNIDDLLGVINAWGPCPNPSNCPADIAPIGGNDVVNIDDLLAVINAWGPCP